MDTGDVDAWSSHGPRGDRDRLLHDLRTSLTIITGNAQLLERWLHDGATRQPKVMLAVVMVICASAQDMKTRLQELENEGRGGPPRDPWSD